MSEPSDNTPNDKQPATVGDVLRSLVDSFTRAEITLPKAIIIAAALIALGLIFS